MRIDEIHVEVRGKALDGTGTFLDRQGTILNRDLNLKATTRWSGVGEWSLTLPGGHPMVPYLRQPGSGIIVRGPDGPDTADVLFSGPTITPNRKRDVKNPDGTLTFKGVTDEIHLDDALAFPSPQASADPRLQTKANDTRTGAAEDLLRQYVAYNIASTHALAGRLGGFRQFIVLSGGTLNRGSTITKAPRFQNLLELLQEIASTSLLGFRMVQVGDKIEFKVVETRDLRRTIRLDVDAGTLASEETQEQGYSLTRPFVAGQGEGVERKIRVVTTPEATAAEGTHGRIIERWFNQSQTNEDAVLDTKGLEELADAAGGLSVKAIPADTTTMRYGYDWREGDWITVLVDGRELDSVVTEAVFSFTKDTVGVGAAIGDVSTFQAESKSRKKQSTMDSRLSYIEQALGGRQALQTTGKQVTNWNDAKESGWYWSSTGALNTPNGESSLFGRVVAGNNNRVIQEVFVPTTDTAGFRKTWRRVSDGAGWSVWVLHNGQTRHAEFTVNSSLVNAGAGPTAIPTATRDTTYSRQGEFATPIAGGFSVPAGLYTVSISVFISVSPVTSMTRYFAQLGDSVSGRARRPLTGANEDYYAGSLSVYLPSAGNINVAQYQNSGAARNFEMRIGITELE
ncbi:minor tail protein [Microbacterium phage Cicada]|uniref:Minor tail protein n=2 Tax=Goodmanvirus goodman TaxID=2734238 RepID=A0A3G3M066_9CAUD|nr:minor tail protein [Microbacterium phage Goodman]AYQ99478.1 minor tail protein [Microbacterium phage Goodman]AYQ99646.1 minor tail protein [Microbacterium phage Johann]QLF82706.1 minor tail protein [Microbacterium phage Cicada]